jgi:DNA repair exonuclease SbcCD ATPase subunit
MSKFNNYYGYVREQAVDLADEYADSIINEVIDGNTNIYDELTEATHEWVDNIFIYTGIIDHATIIDNSHNVESDSGLWEGQDPESAINTMAFFTLRTDLMDEVRDELQSRLDEKYEEYERKIDDADDERTRLQSELDELQARLDELQDEDEEHDEVLDEFTDKETDLFDLESKIEELTEKLDYIKDAIEEL